MEFKESGLPQYPEVEKAFNYSKNSRARLFGAEAASKQPHIAELEDAKVLVETFGETRLDLVCSALVTLGACQLNETVDQARQALLVEFPEETVQPVIEMVEFIKGSNVCGNSASLKQASENVKLLMLARQVNVAEEWIDAYSSPEFDAELLLRVMESSNAVVEGNMQACEGICTELDNRAKVLMDYIHEICAESKTHLASLSAPDFQP